MSSGQQVRTLIEEQARLLGPVLHAGAAASLITAQNRMRGLVHGKYPHLLPLTMRAEMREYLEAHPPVSGWTLDGDSRKMGQLLLAQPKLGLELRFLKERRRTYPEGVPVAGKNAARRAAWDELPLDWPVSSSSAPDLVRLLLLWDFVDSVRPHDFSLRIVHTTAPGVYGKPVPCDLILDVQAGGEIYRRLQFAGSPDEEDFFALVDIEEEENESGS